MMGQHSPAGRAFTRLVLSVFRLNGRLLAAGDRMAATAGQSSARWQVLGVIDHGPQTVAGVARAMDLARQSVQRTADRLVAEGLAAYLGNPADRRADLLRMTSRGRKVLRKIERAQYVWANRLGKDIGTHRLIAAQEVLDRVTAAIGSTRNSG